MSTTGFEESTMYDEINMELFSTPPPTFGHEILSQFFFEPGYINFNHGSYGSLPRPVSAAVNEISIEIEKNPDRFLRRKVLPLLEEARAGVARILGANKDECVFVPNATHGINTVLRNLIWDKEDVIVGTTVTYGAISRTIQYIADVPPNPQTSTFLLQFPVTIQEILDKFRVHLRSIARRPNQKIVAVVDAIVSNPGVLLPWEEMVKICKEEGVISIIDAAHSIGQQTGINLNKADPDFWISNCHKWLFAKRGCAVLYVPKRNQHLIKTSIPTSFSYVSPSDPPGGPEAPNFVAQFSKNGTIDYAPYLSVTHALKFRKWIGGEEKLNAYCHELAIEGGRKLADILGTEVMDNGGELTANMVNVGIPLRTEKSLETDEFIRNTLLDDWNVYAVPYHHNGKWWVRCSTQIWNEISDFEKLGEALKVICKGINEKSRAGTQ